MRIGPFQITLGKTWNQLVSIINQEKYGAQGGPLKTSAKQQFTAYRSWSYSCVSLISDRVSTVPYSFYNKDTNEELTTSSKKYKIFTKPFMYPNHLMTFRFIKSWCQTQLDLCGTTCIYKGINKLGQVWELWPLDMSEFVRVEVSGTFTNPSVTYVFNIGNKTYNFDINELIVINYANPTDLWLGMSPIQAQAYASDIDEYVEIYERDFFKNSARVDFALTTDAIMDQDKADQIKERWLSKFKGRFHDVAILDSGLKPVPLKYTNRDFEFLALAKWSKEKILSAYRVPENKLGSVESNRQGSVFSDISFNRESIKPRLVLWDEELTMGVCSSYDLRLQVRHNDPIPRDRQLEVMEAKTYLAGLPSKTIDEYRKEVHNLPPVDGGNKLIIPNKFIYLEDMDKVTGALINPPQNERDRDNETPHVNPDGTDDRDDNPTDGRSISIEPELKIINMDSFFSLYVTIGSIWNKMCFDYLITNDPIFIQENFKILFNDLSEVTIDVLSKNFEKDTIITSNDCIYSLIEKASIEYIATLFKEGWDKVDWKEYVNIEFKTNVRLSKIINTIVKAHINFVKYQILIKNKDNIEWVVNSNECGHRGKIKNFIVKDHFESNRTPIKFPGEIWNFTCDCTITRHKGE